MSGYIDYLVETQRTEMGSSTQTNLVEFHVEYYQVGDEIYAAKDEELFNDGIPCCFIDGIKSYGDAIEQDVTYKHEEGYLGYINRDEKFVVKSPFYVFYILSFMGSEGLPNSIPQTCAEMEIDGLSKYDVFDDRFHEDIIKLAKPDFDRMSGKIEPSKETDDIIDWDYIRPIENKLRSKDQPLSTNIITVWNFSYYYYSSMDGDDVNADWDLLGRLDLGQVVKTLSPVSPALPVIGT